MNRKSYVRKCPKLEKKENEKKKTKTKKRMEKKSS